MAEEHGSDIWFRIMCDSAIEYAIFSLDDGGLIATWNTGAEQLLGFPREEVVGEPAAIVFTAEDREDGMPEQEMETARREGSATDKRWHTRKDGSHFWGAGRLMRIDREGVNGYVKVVRDLTAEKRADLALRESEERFARIFVANPAGMALAAAETGRFTAANESFSRLTGYWRADFVGRSAEELRLWTEPAGGELSLQRLASGADPRGRLVGLRRKSGESGNALAMALRTSFPPDEDVILLVLVDLDHVWPSTS